MESRAQDYRPDIDGLRAVAVLSVLIYHFNGAKVLPGGFAGVDVFFVISGFLITQRLAEEIRDGTFSVLAFYDRRLRRIMPALLAMLAATLLLGRYMLLPGDYAALAKSSAAAAFGASNFYFLYNTGYFDQAAGLMPLLHTWSLAVEEQFYLVWPFFLFLIAAGRSRAAIAAVAIALAIAGFGASLIWHNLDAKAAFFMALPRAWELLIGSALVFLPRLAARSGEAAVVCGIAAIVASLFFLNEASSAALLVPCLGSALILWPRSSPSVGARWLGRLAPIGLISYSLYLWHWPVWVFFRIYINNGMPSPRETAALAAVSILIAVLSYRFIEQPFRKPRLVPAKTVLATISVATGIFCASMFIDSADGLPGRISRDAYAMRSLNVMWEWPTCNQNGLVGRLPYSCTFGVKWDEAKSKAILWGDSNAVHLTPLLEDPALRSNTSVALFSTCPAVLGGKSVRDNRKLTFDFNERCRQTRAGLLDFVSKDANIRTIILSASWEAVAGALASTDGQLSGNPGKLLEDGLSEIIDDLSALGKRVIVVATMPTWDIDPIPCAISRAGLPRRQCKEF